MNNWLYGKFVAHRGLHTKTISENTLLAFENAIAHGYNIELDVQQSKDGKLVVYHDLNLGRLTNCAQNVSETDYRSLMQDIRYRATGQSIPDFSSALAVCKGRAGLMIEVKKCAYEANVIDMEPQILQTLRAYEGEFVVKSFNPFTVLWFLEHAPEFTVGFLSEYDRLEDYLPESRAAVEKILFTGERRADFFDYCVGKIGSPLWNSVHGKMPCFAWVVRSQLQYEQCKKQVSNIIFEDFLPEM